MRAVEILKSHRRVVVTLILLEVYFGIALVEHWWPPIGQSLFFTFYILSVPLVLACLVVVGVAAAILWAREHPRGRPLLVCALGGLALFGLTAAIDKGLARGLPTGSYVRSFDPGVWQAETSSRNSDGDITLRQKMLGDVVRHVLPGRTRDQIEKALGPSLDTPYFRESGRTLIYVTGPERNFISIDSEWLLIWVDKQGRFAKYEVRTD